MVVTNDAFAFRSGEIVNFKIGSVDGCRYAFMAAPITALPSPMRPATPNGDAAEPCCIVAAQLVGGLWQWMHLNVDAKEIVGDAIFDNELERGVWHGAVIAANEASDG